MKKKKNIRLQKFLKFIEEFKRSINIKVTYQDNAYSYCANSTKDFRVERMHIILMFKSKKKKLYQFFFFNRFIDRKKNYVRYKFFGYKKIYKDIDEFLQKHAIKYTHKKVGVWHSFRIGKEMYNKKNLSISIEDKNRRSGDLINMTKMKEKFNKQKNLKSKNTSENIKNGKIAWKVFNSIFEEELELEYSPRPKRVRNINGRVNVVQSDKVRIKNIFVDHFKCKSKLFRKYCKYIINDVWGTAGAKYQKIESLIGFIENNRHIDNFKISLKMKKKNSKIAGKRFSKKIDRRWENE